MASQRSIKRAVAGLTCVLFTVGSSSGALSPIELTTDSLLVVHVDHEGNVALTARNAPVEDIVKAIIAKTGLTVELPESIRGRCTGDTIGKAKNVLEWACEVNELGLRREAYRAKPVKWTYIAKTDGGQRPIGVPTFLNVSWQFLYSKQQPTFCIGGLPTVSCNRCGRSFLLSLISGESETDDLFVIRLCCTASDHSG